MCCLTSRLVRPLSCLALSVLVIVSTGCTSRAGQLDAEVARVVDQEDRRLARRTAVAAVDLDPLQLASVGALVETLRLLYVPDERNAGAAESSSERIGAAKGWGYQPPPGWLVHPWPWSTAGGSEWSEEASLFDDRSGDGAEAGISDERGVGRRKRRARKPKIRVDFLRLRINDRPVSFSGSMKGLKGVQLKATIKL